MANEWNLGSFGESILALVPDVPAGLSGTQINNIVTRKISFVEEYTGQTIGTTSVAVKYQEPVLNLALSEVTQLMTLQGSDANNVSLGDFSIGKGKGSNASDTAEYYKKVGLDALKNLGKKCSTYQTFHG